MGFAGILYYNFYNKEPQNPILIIEALTLAPVRRLHEQCATILVL